MQKAGDEVIKSLPDIVHLFICRELLGPIKPLYLYCVVRELRQVLYFRLHITRALTTAVMSDPIENDVVVFPEIRLTGRRYWYHGDFIFHFAFSRHLVIIKKPKC